MNYFYVIIFIYLSIIILFVLFHIGISIYGKISKFFSLKKKKKYKRLISNSLFDLKEVKYVSEEDINFLKKKLKRIHNLYIFEDVLSDFFSKNPTLVLEYCKNVSGVFHYLSGIYREKSSLQKAYFTHVLSLFPDIIQDDDNSIHYAMMHFVFDSSIHCRENAMLFFYHKGSYKQVVNSLKKINHRDLYYSPKLMSDDLLEFRGDKLKLTSLLLADYDDFSYPFQIAIINFIRLSDGDRRKEIFHKLLSHKYHKEVELAMIRYFATHYFVDIIELFLKILNDHDTYNFEYRLVTAFSLGNYDSPVVHQALIKCLTDENFYVRKNAAVSLSQMSLTNEEVKQIMGLKDSYAKEMFTYIWPSLEEESTGVKKKGVEVPC